MTRLRRERSYKRLSKGRVGERAAAAEDQKNSTAMVSIAGSPPKWRMIVERVSQNSPRPMTCRLKQFTIFFTTICCSQEVGQLSDQTALQGDEEGAIQNMAGDPSDDRHGFLTILDNILTVNRLAGAKSKLAGLSLNQEASQKELEGV
jgi:hypothetical protein